MPTPLVMGQTLGTLRSNFSGCVGLEFTLSVTRVAVQLGRWKVAGNTQTHTLRVMSGPNVTLFTASLDLSSVGVAGDYARVDVSPVALVPGTYYVFSGETSGGDEWYDDDSIVVPGAGPIPQAAFETGCGADIQLRGTADRSYGPVNIWFQDPLSRLQLPVYR